METIEVTVRFDSSGKITPLDFTWQGQKYAITSTGRRWDDSRGQHILVMVPGEQVYELIFDNFYSRWYLGRFGSERRMA